MSNGLKVRNAFLDLFQLRSVFEALAASSASEQLVAGECPPTSAADDEWLGPGFSKFVGDADCHYHGFPDSIEDSLEFEFDGSSGMMHFSVDYLQQDLLSNCSSDSCKMVKSSSTECTAVSLLLEGPAEICYHGDFIALQRYVNKVRKNGCSVSSVVNQKEPAFGMSLLHITVLGASRNPPEHGRYEFCLWYLLELGVDINARDDLGRTPLMYCTSRLGKQEMLQDLARLLISYGADVNIPDNNGVTVLHRSSLFSDAYLAEILLNAGADIKAEDYDGVSAAYCIKYSPEVLKVLSKFSRSGIFRSKLRVDEIAKNYYCAKCYKVAIRKCARCLAVNYCSRQCQQDHWNGHSAYCHEIFMEHVLVDINTGYLHRSVAVRPLSSDETIYEGERAAINGHCIIKVQLPVSSVSSFPSKSGGLGPILCYNKSRSVQCIVDSYHCDYQRLASTVRKDGILQLKAYFSARIDSEGMLRIYIGKPHRALSW